MLECCEEKRGPEQELRATKEPILSLHEYNDIRMEIGVLFLSSLAGINVIE